MSQGSSNKDRLKLLLVSHGVPPSARASTIVVNNLTSDLSDIDIYMAGEIPYKIDNSQIFEKSKVFYVGISLAKYIPRGRRFLKWINRLEFPLVVKRIKKIIKQNSIDGVMCIFPSEYYLEAGYKASVELNKPLICYFHNTYSENRKNIKKAIQLENKVFAYSKLNLAISEGLTDHYNQRDPSLNFKTLTHTYEIPEYWPLTSKPLDPNNLKFAFSGTLNESCYDATLRFYEKIKNTNHEISFYTKITEKKLNNIGITTNYTYKGLVPWEHLRKELNKHDFCLLTHGYTGGLSQIEYKTIFPTRLIPLLYSGKPLIAICPSNSFVSKFLRKNNCAFVINEKEIQKLDEMIEHLTNNFKLQKKLVENAYKVTLEFDKNKVQKKLLKFLQSI